MLDLNTLQATLHGALRGEVPLDVAAREAGVDPARLAVYRRFVSGHVGRALQASFPVLFDVLPPDSAARCVSAYFAAHPPTTWAFDAAAEAFPDFLERLFDTATAPPGVDAFHVALCRVEWELSVAYGHPADMPQPSEMTTRALNATLSLLAVGFPVVDFLAKHRPGEPSRAVPAALEAPETVFVFRHPVRETACYYRATGDLLFALKVTHEGLDPRTAARDAGLPEDAARRAMACAVEIGLVLEGPVPAGEPT